MVEEAGGVVSRRRSSSVGSWHQALYRRVRPPEASPLGSRSNSSQWPATALPFGPLRAAATLLQLLNRSPAAGHGHGWESRVDDGGMICSERNLAAGAGVVGLDWPSW